MRTSCLSFSASAMGILLLCSRHCKRTRLTCQERRCALLTWRSKSRRLRLRRREDFLEPVTRNNWIDVKNFCKRSNGWASAVVLQDRRSQCARRRQETRHCAQDKLARHEKPSHRVIGLILPPTTVVLFDCFMSADYVAP